MNQPDLNSTVNKLRFQNQNKEINEEILLQEEEQISGCQTTQNQNTQQKMKGNNYPRSYSSNQQQSQLNEIEQKQNVKQKILQKLIKLGTHVCEIENQTENFQNLNQNINNDDVNKQQKELRFYEIQCCRICQKIINPIYFQNYQQAQDDLVYNYQNSQIKTVSFTGLSVINNLLIQQTSLEISYIDYIQTFYMKMEMKKIPVNQQQNYFNFNHFIKLLDWAQFIVSDPQKYLKLKDFERITYKIQQLINKNENKLEYPLSLQEDIQKFCNQSSNLNYVQVLGDYESANIGFTAFNQDQNKLQIIIKNDINTKGCLHWFNFTVKVKTECTLTILIMNNTRCGSLYRDGMGIAILDSELPQKGWYRGGDSIYYYKSNVDHSFYQQHKKIKSDENNKVQNTDNQLQSEVQEQRQKQDQNQDQKTIEIDNTKQKNSQKNKQNQTNQLNNLTPIYQTLQFNYTFSKPGQQVTFAYCYPYTYSELISDIYTYEQNLFKHQKQFYQVDEDTFKKKNIFNNSIKKLTQNQEEKQQKKILICKYETESIYYKKHILGYTRLGFPLQMLTITGPKSYKNFYYQTEHKQKKVIFIIARQHPSETTGSFVCSGILDFLLKEENQQARALRAAYVFKIVPMVNIDGVIVGQSRTSPGGFDLNRKWLDPNPALQPEIFVVKQEMKKTQEKREINIFTDLHGHSSKKHSFFYGCDRIIQFGQHQWTQVRLLPKILSKKTNFFQYQECKFKLSADKLSTARVVAFLELKINYSFTFETSFFGYYDKETDKNISYTPQDMKDLGKYYCLSILEMLFVQETINQELKVFNKLPASLNKRQQILLQNYLKQSQAYNGDQQQYQIKKQNAKDKESISENQLSQTQKSENYDKIGKQQKKIRDLSVTNSIYNDNNDQLTKSSSQAVMIKRYNTCKEQGSSNEQLLNLNPSQLKQDEKDYVKENFIINKSKKSQNGKEKQKIKKVVSNQNNDQIEQCSKQIEHDFSQGSDDNIKSQPNIFEICPDIRISWRKYFRKNEIKRNFRKIEIGLDPNQEESDSGSDSDPEGELQDVGKTHITKEQKIEFQQKSEIVIIQKPNQQPSQNQQTQQKKEEKPEWKPSSNTNILNTRNFQFRTGKSNQNNTMNSNYNNNNQATKKLKFIQDIQNGDKLDRKGSPSTKQDQIEKSKDGKKNQQVINSNNNQQQLLSQQQQKQYKQQQQIQKDKINSLNEKYNFNQTYNFKQDKKDINGMNKSGFSSIANNMNFLKQFKSNQDNYYDKNDSQFENFQENKDSDILQEKNYHLLFNQKIENNIKGSENNSYNFGMNNVHMMKKKNNQDKNSEDLNFNLSYKEKQIIGNLLKYQYLDVEENQEQVTLVEKIPVINHKLKKMQKLQYDKLNTEPDFKTNFRSTSMNYEKSLQKLQQKLSEQNKQEEEKNNNNKKDQQYQNQNGISVIQETNESQREKLFQQTQYITLSEKLESEKENRLKKNELIQKLLRNKNNSSLESRNNQINRDGQDLKQNKHNIPNYQSGKSSKNQFRSNNISGLTPRQSLSLSQNRNFNQIQTQNQNQTQTQTQTQIQIQSQNYNIPNFNQYQDHTQNFSKFSSSVEFESQNYYSENNLDQMDELDILSKDNSILTNQAKLQEFIKSPATNFQKTEKNLNSQQKAENGIQIFDAFSPRINKNQKSHQKRQTFYKNDNKSNQHRKLVQNSNFESNSSQSKMQNIINSNSHQKVQENSNNDLNKNNNIKNQSRIKSFSIQQPDKYYYDGESEINGQEKNFSKTKNYFHEIANNLSKNNSVNYLNEEYEEIQKSDNHVQRNRFKSVDPSYQNDSKGAKNSETSSIFKNYNLNNKKNIQIQNSKINLQIEQDQIELHSGEQSNKSKNSVIKNRNLNQKVNEYEKSKYYTGDKNQNNELKMQNQTQNQKSEQKTQDFNHDFNNSEHLSTSITDRRKKLYDKYNDNKNPSNNTTLQKIKQTNSQTKKSKFNQYQIKCIASNSQNQGKANQNKQEKQDINIHQGINNIINSQNLQKKKNLSLKNRLENQQQRSSVSYKEFENFQEQLNQSNISINNGKKQQNLNDTLYQNVDTSLIKVQNQQDQSNDQSDSQAQEEQQQNIQNQTQQQQQQQGKTQIQNSEQKTGQQKQQQQKQGDDKEKEKEKNNIPEFNMWFLQKQSKIFKSPIQNQFFVDSLEENKQVDIQQAFVLGICGGSSSGKTLLSEVLRSNIQKFGEKHSNFNYQIPIIKQSDFHKDLKCDNVTQEDFDKNPEKYVNYDQPESIDFEKLIKILKSFKNKVPGYLNKQNENNQKRVKYIADIVIVEGTMIFNSKEVRDLCDLKIFLESDEDIRLSRRIFKQCCIQKKDINEVIDIYRKNTKIGYEKYTFPTKKYANIVIPNFGGDYSAINYEYAYQAGFSSIDNSFVELIISILSQRLTRLKKEDMYTQSPQQSPQVQNVFKEQVESLPKI
ncbi:P-loop containing nucleoside triphosphate hydrolase [Pseudocohnilembus persalinus]|uniref:p-loop containing nucleoside triphosphate hydrolase n=1 Tax=Pseudocohnilembus persalinus TaxID=266149 RepID=A0A0V0R6C9_PSEPJ|nr:P-loop containing nucleoside triphosphate hydrolase [Pseudocohnilembus persalinus]|eukprot:KRX10068.1 P-loop containing nucleoside triphosphate hydrolase [Pseudocohnilembus persalinus]